MKVGIVDDIVCEYHLQDKNDSHDKSPKRVQAIRNALIKSNLYFLLEQIPVKPIDRKLLRLAHSQKHIDYVFDMCEKHQTCFLNNDPDICLANTKESLKSVMFAAASAIASVDTIFNKNNNISRVFCNVRPPNHHSCSDKSMGFCIFNNVALAANYAIEKYGLNRVLIIDIDCHHGNGTQDIFWNNAKVWYCSLHQEPPFYPNSGKTTEKGMHNNIYNYPLPEATTEDEAYNIFKTEFLPKAKQYQPQLILISCGFDAHENDPLGGLSYDYNFYRKITRDIVDLSLGEKCNKRIASFLEGGYDLETIGKCATIHINELLSLL